MLWKTLVATLCVIGVAVADQTPVFLWGADSVAKPSLRTVPQAEFQGELSRLLQENMVVVFEENGLSTKDFTCSTKKSGSCYAQLQSVSPKTYYSSVENPSEALRVVAAQSQETSINEKGQLSHPVECIKGKAVFVTFDTTEATHEATLASHDAAIAAITKQFDCKVAYLYLATPYTSPVVSRKARSIQDTAAPTGGFIFSHGNQFQIFFTELQHNKKNVTVTGITITNNTDNTSQFSVSLSTSDTGLPITFDIIRTTDGYFNLKNLKYNKIEFLATDINAPTTFSYFCGDLVLANIAGTDTLTWKSVQLQAPFNAKYHENFAFGDSWDCVGFFTPGILMGLFVVLLLLVIVFTGICWMMDINTMDRFDDPKGKTITINASSE